MLVMLCPALQLWVWLGHYLAGETQHLASDKKKALISYLCTSCSDTVCTLYSVVRSFSHLSVKYQYLILLKGVMRSLYCKTAKQIKKCHSWYDQNALKSGGNAIIACFFSKKCSTFLPASILSLGFLITSDRDLMFKGDFDFSGPLKSVECASRFLQNKCLFKAFKKFVQMPKSVLVEDKQQKKLNSQVKILTLCIAES